MFLSVTFLVFSWGKEQKRKSFTWHLILAGCEFCASYLVQFFTQADSDLTASCMELHALCPTCYCHRIGKDKIRQYRVSRDKGWCVK
jgi:hypothetical protein